MKAGNSIRVTQEQAFSLTHDDFYRAVESIIDDSSPRSHMSCDYLSDPNVFGLVIFPLAVYRKMEELRNAQHSSSREQHPQ